jgi:hypothetical protein
MKNETRVPISKITLRALAILAAAGSMNIATIPVQEHFLYDTQASTRFSDDSLIRDYSRSSVESLLATGGIKGYPEDNTFRPQGTITKLEFLSMVVNSLDPDGTKIANAIEQAKNDISEGQSYYQDEIDRGLLQKYWGGKAFDLLVATSELGFYGGFETQTGNDWNTPITRQDAAQFIYDGLHYLKGQDLYEEYKDNNDIWMNSYKLVGDWTELTISDKTGEVEESVGGCGAAIPIRCLYIAGVLQGDSEAKFYPNKYLTREDSAIMIDKAVYPEKRAKVTVEKYVEVDPYAGVTPTTLKQSDKTRRSAVPGDTFITLDGKTITVTKDEKSGVLCANQPVALDANRDLRYLTNQNTWYNHSIGVYGEVKELIDGSNSVELGFIDVDDENVYGTHGNYIVNPETGEGHTQTDWEILGKSFKPTDTGTEGEERKFGLGNWCTYTYMQGKWQGGSIHFDE